jgi:hypothetical protein
MTAGGANGIVEGHAECEPNDEEPWPYHIEMIGTGFDAYEGQAVFARTAMLGGCEASAETEVVDGAFHVLLHSASWGAAYPFFGVFIDSNGDEACSEEDDFARGGIATVSEDRTVVREYTPESSVDTLWPCQVWEQ